MIELTFDVILAMLVTYCLVRGAYVLPRAMATAPEWKAGWGLGIGFGVVFVAALAAATWGQDQTVDCATEFPGAAAAPHDSSMAAILAACHTQNSDVVNSHFLAVALVLGGAAGLGIRAGRAKYAEGEPYRLLIKGVERIGLGRRLKAVLIKDVGAAEVDRVHALVLGMIAELEALGVDYRQAGGSAEALCHLYTKHTGKVPPSLAFTRTPAT